MSRSYQLAALLFLSMFVFVEIAEARLIRGGGRAELSRVYEQTIYYVDNQYNNAAGIIEDFGNSQVRFRDSLRDLSAKAFINGDNNPISAFPGGEGCTRGYVAGEVQDARDRIGELEGIGNNRTPSEEAELATLLAFIAEVELSEPCKWEFDYGEAIDVEGLFQLAFLNQNGSLATDVNYDVVWNINGEDHAGEIGLTDSQPSALLSLNKLIDLNPGVYDISVSVGLSSDKGRFYYETEEPSDGSADAVVIEPNPVCVDNPDFIDEQDYISNFEANNPGATQDDIDDALDEYYNNPTISDSLVCGHNSVVQNVNAGTLDQDIFNYNQQTRYFSLTETLIILDANNTPPAPASAPYAFTAFLMGLVGLGIRRRMIIQSKQ
ncbi:hypothetical protein [Glaciecola petra]|uniref:PEP-CTERM protein-sorting domain-containing protein n=1 Tax=Glaciecola petra TaxID=3075602 RepID=A0ABU2ZUU7_9ALTE|nr:hypothetical protein [Aestuariibacter sp. P117]MDT0596418.1 hypothetical protein [Aestuariibacter sp. P117]